MIHSECSGPSIMEYVQTVDIAHGDGPEDILENHWSKEESHCMSSGNDKIVHVKSPYITNDIGANNSIYANPVKYIASELGHLAGQKWPHVIEKRNSLQFSGRKVG